MFKVLALVVVLGLVAEASAGAWYVTGLYNNDCQAVSLYTYDAGLCTANGNSGSYKYSCIDSATINLLRYSSNDCSGQVVEYSSTSLEAEGYVTSCSPGQGVQNVQTCSTSKILAENVIAAIFQADNCEGDIYGLETSDLVSCADLPESSHTCQAPYSIPYVAQDGSLGSCFSGAGFGGISSDATALLSSLAVLVVSMVAFLF